MATLQTSWAVAQEAGESHSSIRVTNLQTSLPVAKDAWGRQGKLQPVLISASVSLREPFSSASSSDTVTNSTIHYGVLSKAILESCRRCTDIFDASGLAADGFTMEFLMQLIHLFLTHSVIQGQLDADYLRIVNDLVLPTKLLKSLEIVIKLPKASLVGIAVSLRYHLTYKIDGQGPDKFSSVLKLHDLRIPTLVGVNPNERLAKQVLVVNVELDPWIQEESYNELEEIVFKVLISPRFLPLVGLPSYIMSMLLTNRPDSRGVFLPDSRGVTFPPL
jgi:dihydroneopterin aldolase